MIGLALIVSGLADLWFRLRATHNGSRMRVIAESAVTVGAGLVLVLYPEESIEAVMVIAGIHFVIRGLTATIAVALVPPVGVVGLTLHAGTYGDAFGAFTLFVSNLVSIILAAMIVFALTGFAPMSKMKENANEIKRVEIAVVVAVILIAIPLAFTVSNISRRSW